MLPRIPAITLALTPSIARRKSWRGMDFLPLKLMTGSARFVTLAFGSDARRHQMGPDLGLHDLILTAINAARR